MRDKTDTVPVIVFTLCRYEHLVRCIESLKRNFMAKETDLFIGIDYPSKEEHFDGYNKIVDYVKEINGFRKVQLVFQEKNIGAYNNSETMKKLVSTSYDRYIVSEDDNEFSPNFLEYMNIMMNYYDNDESIFAVSGYNYNIDNSKFTSNYYENSMYFSAFGYGIWREKKRLFEDKCNSGYFGGYFANGKKMRELYKKSPNQFCNFVRGFLEYTPDLVENEKIKPIDLAMGIYMFFEGKKMVFPVISKVRNWGFDGSGQHCPDNTNHLREGRITHRNYDYSTQQIDSEERFSISTNELEELETDDLYNEFFSVDFGERIKCVLAYYGARVIGVNRVRNILRRI